LDAKCAKAKAGMASRLRLKKVIAAISRAELCSMQPSPKPLLLAQHHALRPLNRWLERVAGLNPIHPE
jgi:hypothetical protein